MTQTGTFLRPAKLVNYTGLQNNRKDIDRHQESLFFQLPSGNVLDSGRSLKPKINLYERPLPHQTAPRGYNNTADRLIPTPQNESASQCKFKTREQVDPFYELYFQIFKQGLPSSQPDLVPRDPRNQSINDRLFKTEVKSTPSF